jgi:hypothetical protein
MLMTKGHTYFFSCSFQRESPLTFVLEFFPIKLSTAKIAKFKNPKNMLNYFYCKTSDSTRIDYLIVNQINHKLSSNNHKQFQSRYFHF